MAPGAVRMVLVEGENGDGALVDAENFVLAAHDARTSDAADQVVAAILGTRQGAAEGGYQLTSTGVTWRDPDQAAALRNALAARKIENVMLVSAFLAAAALAHSVGNETNYAQTALLFVEPDTATLAVVHTADGSIADIHRRPLPDDDDAAVAQLADLVACAEDLETRPGAVFVVGSGVDIPMIKPTLDAATTLPVTAPEEPETALARGAALASAHTPLLASSTAARAYAQDPGTGAHDPYGLDPALFEHVDTGLAYSAATGSAAAADADADADADAAEGEGDERKSFALLGSILASIFVIGVASLVVSLAISIRSTSSARPEPGQVAVAPAQPAPQAATPAPQAPAPAPQAPAPEQVPQAPAPVPEQAPIPEQGPVPQQLPVEVPEAPAPQAPVIVPQAPAAPVPAPAAPIPVPVPVPIPVLPPILSPQWPVDGPGGGRGGGGKPPGVGKIPGVPGGPGAGGPGRGGGGGGRGGGGKGPGGGGKGPGGGGRGGFNIPLIPGI